MTAPHIGHARGPPIPPAQCFGRARLRRRPLRELEWPMARKLKAFTTSAGFFDLAVAAPSMKAALEAWGSRSDLFQHGFARVSEDPEVVAATMAKPGVVLRRPVGSDGRFSEDAKLPGNLLAGKLERKPPKRKAEKKEPPPVDDKAARAAERQAALAFEKEDKRREAERRREDAKRQKERERREEAIAAAEAALEEARQDHERRAEKIEKDRAALDRKSEAEDARWRKKKEQLEEALRRARSPSHLRLV